MITNDYFDTNGFGAGPDYINGLRQTFPGHEKHMALNFAHPLAQGHGLGSRSCFIQQRCVGQVHSGEVRYHCLVVEDRFQTALRNLWLIRRISGIPCWVFQ